MVVLDPGEVPDLPADRVRQRVDAILQVGLGQAVERVVRTISRMQPKPSTAGRTRACADLPNGSTALPNASSTIRRLTVSRGWAPVLRAFAAWQLIGRAPDQEWCDDRSADRDQQKCADRRATTAAPPGPQPSLHPLMAHLDVVVSATDSRYAADVNPLQGR